MPEGLLYIHDYAFAGNQLVHAVIPNSVIEVGSYAFAYNEIASKPTIDPINILESKFSGDFSYVDNEGNISQSVSTIGLKDHVFIISSMGNHLIEDIGANQEQSEDNNDEDVNNNDRLMRPIDPRNPLTGEVAIDSAEEFAKIGQPEYPLSGKYILKDNIDLSGFNNWVPIGNNISKFTGTFNGNGYKINNLTIDKRLQDYVGLFGYTERAIILNVALEDINVTGYRHVGGLVGNANNSTIIDSYATGLVEGSIAVGGLVGSTGSSGKIVTRSYWDKETSRQSTSAGGTGKTTLEMKLKGTYEGWDFVNVWKIDEGNDYPKLR